jgi:hypothetical protein
MAISRRIRKAARDALSNLRSGPRKAKRPGNRGRLAPDPLAPRGIDKRLSQVAADVRAGRFVEQTWDLFRITYFPALTEDQAANLLGDWCKRHGFEAFLSEGKTELSGKLHTVIRLRLTLAS